MKVLTFLCVCICFLIFSAWTYADQQVVVQPGDSLSEILLRHSGDDDICHLSEVLRALRNLEDTEDGVAQLQAFGVSSGDVDALRPHDVVQVGVIWEWFEAEILDAADDSLDDLAAFIEDGEIVDEDVPITPGESENSSEKGEGNPESSTNADEEDALEGGADSSAAGTEEGDTDLPEEVLLGDTSDEDPSSEEDALAEQIQDIAEDARKRESGSSGLDVSLMLGYRDSGVDDLLLEYFFQGPITSQGISFSHPSSGIHFAVTNFTSVEGGIFSDVGDRTNFSIGLRRTFGSFYGIAHHQWVHTNYRMEENFYYGDRHRTSFQVGLSGWFHPYVFISSDIPAYMPMDEMMVYGGGGVALTVPISFMNTEIEIGASCAGSLFWYYREQVLLYRLYAGFETAIGGLAVRPEISFLTDVLAGGEMLTTAVGITF